MRIATFNLENLDDGPGVQPPLAERIRIMRPQLERVAADILCLQEVNSQGAPGARTLAALDQLLAGTAYAGFNRQTTLTTGGQLYDQRNLVTLSRFPVTGTQIVRDGSGPRPSYRMATANPPDAAANPLEWERPMLVTQIDLGAGRTLHLINVHLKSKLASSIPGQKIDPYTWRSASAWAEGSFISAMKRFGQALQARLLIDGIFDAQGTGALIAMAGDFNAEADEVSFRAILGPVEETGNPEHAPRVMIPCENNVPDSARYSLFHLGKGNMLDHIVASRSLLRHFRGAEIHNEALPDESGAFRQDTKFPESDHAPVVAVFDL
ncbi:MAG: endonuclease/exonuclease/phosphatase family protein [Burkholderiales bacterium]